MSATGQSLRRAPHIVCFAPYTDWSIHSARQVTILQALRQRGCSVTYVTCDGAFSDCDLLQASTGAPTQRPANACLFCQARVATRLAGWGMPFRWLGQWLTTTDRQTAARWVQSLKTGDYLTAQYDDWAVGAWVRSSVHSHFRHNTLDFEDPTVAAVFASYLYSGLLACFGLARLFDEEKPEAQLLFNGRMGPTRIALELATARGIRTICEERGYVPGRLQLYDNVSCIDFSAVEELWSQWRSVELQLSDIDEIGAILEDRWHGRSSDVSAFSSAIGKDSAIWPALGFDPDRQLWALYTSSIDESADADYGDEVFASQFDWIDATVEYVASHPDLQLAIRIHPNAGSRKSLGRNQQDAAYFEALALRLPKNVRLIAADSPISSYALAIAASAALVWFSTIGVEIAALGRSVVRVAGGPLAQADFMHVPKSADEYTPALNQLRREPAPEDQAATIQAWRFAHLVFLRRSMAFPLVQNPKWFVGEMGYDSPAALQPGRDPSLDRICSIFIDGKGLFDPPPPRRADISLAEAKAIAARIAPYQRGKASIGLSA